MEESITVSPLLGEARTKIIEELADGPKSVGYLSEKFQLNKTAIIQHLNSLEKNGYVRAFFQKEKAGRPTKQYEITVKGMQLFPKKYAELLSLFLDQFIKDYGDTGMNMMLSKIADRLINAETIGPADTRDDKIRKLQNFIEILNNLGYHAKIEVEGDIARIIRYNCIFYELAKNRGDIICGVLDRDIIKKVGEDNIVIKEKFSEGTNRCVVELSLVNR
ncbi:helix-turn-helix transcriptional regulator [Caldiplasma sukawensis]